MRHIALMDFFSHALLPYLLGRFLRLRRDYLAALVLGGIAPDLDTLVVWINQIHPTSYLIVHRGFTHTFFFGFFVAAILLYLVSRTWIKARSRGFITKDLQFTPATLAFAYTGIISHLFLDYLTSGGVPLFYPLTAARYSAEIFSRIEFVIMIATIMFMAKLLRDRPEMKIDKKVFAAFLIFLVIVSGIRLEGKEMANGFYDDSSKIYPDSNLFQWTILKNDSDNDRFQIFKFNLFDGLLPDNSSYLHQNATPHQDGLDKALEKAESLPQVKLFRWRSSAVAINASEKDGGWVIDYYDPVIVNQYMNNWLPLNASSRGFGSIRVMANETGAIVV